MTDSFKAKQKWKTTKLLQFSVEVFVCQLMAGAIAAVAISSKWKQMFESISDLKTKSKVVNSIKMI